MPATSSLNRAGSVRHAHMAAGGAPSMTQSMEHTRLGLLFLFSHIEFGSSTIVATQGALNAVGVSTYFASEIGAKMLSKNGASSTGPSMNGKAPSGLDPKMMATITKVAGTAGKEVFGLAEKAVGMLDNNDRDEPVPAGWKEELRAVRDLVLPQIKDLSVKAVESAIYFIVPFLKNSVHLVESIAHVIETAVKEYRTSRLEHDVGILSGSPSIIVSGVKTAMDRNWGRGVMDAASNAFALGTEIVSAGTLKSFVSFITSIVETVVSTVWKIYEIRAMSRFCDQAAEYFKVSASPESIHRDSRRFADWIRGPFARIPMLPCLAIKSRLCGDAATMAALVNHDGTPVGSAEFQKARSYFGSLITHAADYMDNNKIFVKGRSVEGGSFAEAMINGKEKFDKAAYDRLDKGHDLMKAARKGQLADALMGTGAYRA